MMRTTIGSKPSPPSSSVPPSSSSASSKASASAEAAGLDTSRERQEPSARKQTEHGLASVAQQRRSGSRNRASQASYGRANNAMKGHLATRSFVPPAARRKGELRAKKQKAAKRSNLLALVAILAGIVIFLALNVRYHSMIKWRSLDKHNADGDHPQLKQRSGSIRRRASWVSPQSQPFNQNDGAQHAHHLIMVAGHSVTISGHLEDAGVDEADWYLLDYQKGKGLPQAIQLHINAGIQAANDDPDSLLIFSGGETRPAAGPSNEGSSYFRVADAMELWPSAGTVRSRTTTEEFATDSFQNLLFSICRFREVTGHYPTKITTVSFSFKQRRFQEMHAAAMQWPADAFHFIGVDPSADTGFDLKASSEGEAQNAAQPFERDPYGCSSPILKEKRKGRNPFSRTPPYSITCPEMMELLNWCGPDIIPKDRVPWSDAR